MKKLLVLGLLALQGCAVRQYQVVMLATKSTEIFYGTPKNHVDADKQALVINATGQGEVVAWVQRAKPTPKVKKLKFPYTLPKELSGKVYYAER